MIKTGTGMHNLDLQLIHAISNEISPLLIVFNPLREKLRENNLLLNLKWGD